MTDDKIINATALNASNDIKYAKPRANKSGGKSVAILNNETGKILYISTPLMLTWGVEEYVDESSGRRTYSMSLQFPRDEYRTPETDAFLKNMIAFQDKIRDDAVKNCKEWFNKSKMTLDVVDALMTPILRYPKDPNTGEPDLTRAPSMKVKLDFWDEAFNCEIYNLKSEPLFPSPDGSDVGPVQLIPKGTNTATVLRCGGFWFAAGKFGVTWRLFQAVVKPRASLKGKCHIQLSAAESTKLENQSDGEEDEDDVGVELVDDSEEEEDIAKEVKKEVAANDNDNDNDDDDDDNNDAPSFTTAAAPPPAASKKVVKKKAVKKKKVVKKASSDE